MDNMSLQAIRRLGNSIRSWQCCFCEQNVDEGDVYNDNLGFSRIGGDSANGYEAYHWSCVNELNWLIDQDS